MKNNTNNTNKKENSNELLALYGGKAFCKCYIIPAIEKVKFSLANKGDEKNGTDIYMNIEDFACDLIEKIRNGYIYKKMLAVKAGQAQGDIWESRVSSNADQSVLRSFKIQAGQKTDLVIYATETNGEKKKSFTVGFSYRELELLAYRWKFLEPEWEKIMSERYCFANMVTPYDEAQAKQYKEQHSDEASHTSSKASSLQADEEAPMTQKPSFGAEASAEPEAAKSEKVTAEIRPFKMKTSTTLQEHNGNFYLKAFSEENEEVIVMFNNIVSSPEWQDNKHLFENTGIVFSCKGIKKDGKVFVNSFAS